MASYHKRHRTRTGALDGSTHHPRRPRQREERPNGHPQAAGCIRVYLGRDATYAPGRQFHAVRLPVKASDLVVAVLRFGVVGYGK